MATPPPSLSYELYFAAPADEVWAALTDGALTEKYFYGTRLRGSLEEGGALAYTAGDLTLVECEVLEVQRARRLVLRQRARWDERVARDAASTVRWELTALGDGASKLTLVHDGFGGETETFKQSSQGWPLVLSSMKTLVETGKPLAIPRG